MRTDKTEAMTRKHVLCLMLVIVCLFAGTCPGSPIKAGAMAQTLPSESQAQRRLNVAGSSVLGEPTTFRLSYPDVAVTWRPMVISAEDAFKQIIAQDASMDIYNLHVNRGFRKLAEKGYVTSLKESTAIREDILQMYPSVQGLLSNDNGEPVAWPTALFIDRPQISTALWALCYPGQAMPRTLDELLAAMTRWEAELADDWHEISFVMHFDHAYLAQYIVDAYIQSQEMKGEPINFGDPKLKDMLLSLEQICALRKGRGANTAFVAPDRFEPKPFIFDPGMYAAAFNETQKTVYESRQEFVYGVNPKLTTNLALAFREGDPAYYRGRMMAWIVNPYSQHRDLAIAYIEHSLGKDVAPEMYYALHPQASEPYPDRRFDERTAQARTTLAALKQAVASAEGAELNNLRDQLSYLEKWLANAEHEQWRISADSIAEYRRIGPDIHYFENSVPLYAREFTVDKAYELIFKRYAQGQRTLNQLLDDLKAMMALIVMED